MNQELVISNDFEQYCESIGKKYKIPGLAIGLAKNGHLVYKKEYGFRNVEEQLKVSLDTVFGIGSVTKSFTCIAIMQLQEAGKLSVHDQVTKYIPEFKTPDANHTKQLTIEHFMTHTTGIPPLSTLYAALKRSLELEPVIGKKNTETAEEVNEEQLTKTQYIDTYEELIKTISNAKYELLGPPGKEFSYSNDCYALLGFIIERVSGLSYESYIKQNILDPIGMKNSVFTLDEIKHYKDISYLYDSRFENNETTVFESNNPIDAPSMRSAGFLKSTINDMLKYTEIFRNNGKVGEVSILTRKSVEDMMTPFIECDNGGYYGYGLMIIPNFFGYKLIEHGGSIKGVAAQMHIIPELGLTGVGIANLAGVPTTKLLYSMFNEFVGQSIGDSHKKFVEINLTNEELLEYEGDFQSGEGVRIKIHTENDNLYFTTDGLPVTPLKSMGFDSFLLNMRETDFIVTFIRNEQNKIHRLSFGFRQIQKVG